MKRSTRRRGTRMVYRFTGQTEGGDSVVAPFKATKRFIREHMYRKIGAGERVLIRMLDEKGRYLQA